MGTDPVRRIEALREDIRVAVDAVKVEAGSLMIVRPSNHEHIWPPMYVHWIADALSRVVPPGTKYLILAQNDAEFAEARPIIPADLIDPEAKDAYLEGWADAVKAIAGVEVDPYELIWQGEHS